MNDFFENWTVQVRKGFLELCILNALKEEERYGYDLVKCLVRDSGLGVTEGTIYPLLSRLHLQGYVRTRLEASSSGPARKYYSLTSAGEDALALMISYFEQLLKSSRFLKLGRK